MRDLLAGEIQQMQAIVYMPPPTGTNACMYRCSDQSDASSHVTYRAGRQSSTTSGQHCFTGSPKFYVHQVSNILDRVYLHISLYPPYRLPVPA